MKSRILYILVPDDHISPFDVTLAVDAGFSQVLPFTGVVADDVVPMVQDAIFSRPPKCYNDTGVFIGGRDVHMATDMLEYAKSAMVGPFEVGIFADPNGAYTTSASVLALVDKALRDKTGQGIKDRNVAVFGTGPVGLSTAVLAAQQGAQPKLCQLIADEDKRVATRFCQRYNVDVPWVSAQTLEEQLEIVREAEVILCAAKAGIRIIGNHVLDHAENLLVAADTNAVPPSGVEGIGAQDNAVEIKTDKVSFMGIGPLAIGDLKYKTQYGLFKKMTESEKAAILDFPEAYQFALETLEGMNKAKDSKKAA